MRPIIAGGRYRITYSIATYSVDYLMSILFVHVMHGTKLRHAMALEEIIKKFPQQRIRANISLVSRPLAFGLRSNIQDRAEFKFSKHFPDMVYSNSALSYTFPIAFCCGSFQVCRIAAL